MFKNRKQNKKKCSEKKLNNKGLSLVELLIAVTILSVISVAIYQSIVMSARTNAKAKLQHKATSLAQDVMEGLKAEDINTILHQFTAPVKRDAEGNELVGFDIIPKSIRPVNLWSEVGTFGGYVTGTLQADGTTVYEDDYNKTSDSKYYLYLKNAIMENTTFDVLITLDGSPYVDGGSSGQKYNSDPIVQIPTMDNNYDAITSNSMIYDAEAEAKFQTNIGSGYDPKNIRREIKTILTKETLAGIEAKTFYKVVVEYQYSYKWNGAYSTADDKTYMQREIIYDNSASPEYRLQNVFLFYAPAYSYGEDVISIENLQGLDPTVYIIKQKKTASNLLTQENSYRAKLKVTEASGATTTSLGAICTNMNQNLVTGSNIGAGNFSYELNNTPKLAADLADLKLTDLGNSKSIDRIMNVTVQVFRSGEDTQTSSLAEFQNSTGQQMAVLTGTVRN